MELREDLHRRLERAHPLGLTRREVRGLDCARVLVVLGLRLLVRRRLRRVVGGLAHRGDLRLHVREEAGEQRALSFSTHEPRLYQ